MGWQLKKHAKVMRLHYAERGASGILENPRSALPRRPFMKPYESRMQVLDYCVYSGPRPDDKDMSDWFPMRKPTSIWTWNNSRWVARPRCSRKCGGCVDGKHVVWSRHGCDLRAD